MKRFFVGLLSLLLALSLLVMGAGCTTTSPLSFNNTFSSSTEDPTGYKEEATYTVNYLDNYQNIIKKDKALDNYASFEFSNGTYQTVLQTITKSALPEYVQSDITLDLPENATTIYKYTTKFEIDAKYTIDGTDYEYKKDTIETETYFCSYRLSFAPLYTKTVSGYTTLMLSQATATISSGASVCQTTYNKTSYTMDKKYYIGRDLTQLSSEFLISESQDEYEYTYKTIVDNTQLLFILRNIAVQEETNYNLPTVSYQYGQSKYLSCLNTNFSSQSFNLTYNGKAITSQLPVANYTVSLSNGLNSGMPMYAQVLKEKTGEINGLITLSYVQPLICYGDMYCMDVLEYSLTNFSTTQI